MKNKLKLSRIEIVKRSFNAKGNCVKEEWEFYYPPEDEKEIGFKPKKK